MALTAEQIKKLGYSFYEVPENKTELGYVMNPQEFYGAGSSGILQKLDSGTAEYLRSLGLLQTTDRSSTGALSRYNTVGGNTINQSFLEGQYGQIASRQAAQAEEQRVSLGNAAIKAGNVADVEKYFPGFTMWNGAFVDKTKIPELEAQGATVQGGNVVGAAPQVPAGSPGATLQSALQANPNLTPQQQYDASLKGTPIPGTTPVSPDQMIDQEMLNAGQLPSSIENMGEADLNKLFESLNSPQGSGANLASLFGGAQDQGVQKAQQQSLAIQKQLNDFYGSFEAGQDKIEGQTIPMDFIQGQQAGLQKQAQRTEANLLRSQQLAQTQLGFAQEAQTKAEERPFKALEFLTGIQALQRGQAQEARAQADEQRTAELFPLQVQQLRQEALQGQQPKFTQVGDSLLRITPDGKVSVAYRDTSGGIGSIDQAGLLAYAQQYASTGKIPTGLPKGTFGIVSQLAAALPKQQGSVIDNITGVKPDITDARIDGYSALYDLITKLDTAKSQFKGIQPGLVGGLFGKAFGSDKQYQYLQTKKEITDLLARARTGATLNPSEEAFYASYLPSRFNDALFLGTGGDTKIDQLKTLIEGTLQSKLNAQGLRIEGFVPGMDPSQFDQGAK